MYAVKMTKGNLTQTFGTYDNAFEAAQVAAEHEARGYWSQVWVEAA